MTEIAQTGCKHGSGVVCKHCWPGEEPVTSECDCGQKDCKFAEDLDQFVEKYMPHFFRKTYATFKKTVLDD